MNKEEKAKAYEMAIERAKEFINATKTDTVGKQFANIIKEFFPELAEFEDERIRKALIDFFNRGAENGEQTNGVCDKDILSWLEKQGQVKESVISQHENKTCKENDDSLTGNDEKIREALIEMVHDTTGDSLWIDYNVHKEDALDWLEKQGEHKPFDYENATIVQKDYAPKVEPKFKVMDWVTNSIETVQITGYDIDYGYQVDYKGNLQHRDTDIIEKEYHLWSIQDAEDGDVLYTPKGAGVEGIFLIKGWEQVECTGKTLCSSIGYRVKDDEIVAGGLGAIWWKGVIDPFYPATKEQRDTLFAKMKEAGYKWDKQEKRLIETPKIKEETGVLKQLIDEEKSAWSEEDEQYLLVCKNALAKYQRTDKWDADIISHWLEDKIKTIKNRVQPQSKQEWSEEDERIYKSIIYSFAHNYPLTIQQQEFVKSLKDRYSWKPTYEQMEALWGEAEKYLESDDSNVIELKEKVLESLYNDLKKLRGE